MKKIDIGGKKAKKLGKSPRKREKEMEQKINIVPTGTDADVATGTTEQMSRNLVKKISIL